MIKAAFISVNHQEAAYWANLWGYHPQEVYVVTQVRQLHGMRPREDFPVYICGSRVPLDPEFMDYLLAVGFDPIDAQHINVPDNIEYPVGTEWL